MPESQQSITHDSRFKRTARLVASAALIGVVGLALAIYVVVRWAEQQVLSADAWVSYASSLPKNPDVSWAVADTLTNQIFKGVPIDQKIQEALPPRASFLASPLSEQLQERSVRLTQRLVQSDTFQSVWTGANRLAIERLLASARSGKTAERSLGERFSINLAATRPMLRERLAGQAELAPALQEKSQRLLAVTTDLRTRRERLWEFIRRVDFLYVVLPAIFTAGLLGVLVIARDRRRVIMLVAGTSLALLLITLISIKYLRGQVLDEVQNLPYIPAVTYIYDSLVAGLRAAIFYGLGLWAVVLVACLIAGPSRWAMRLRKFLRLPTIAKSRPVLWWHSARAAIGRYRYSLWIGIFGLGLLYLAFFATVSSAVVVNSFMVVLCGVFIVQLLSRPSITRSI